MHRNIHIEIKNLDKEIHLQKYMHRIKCTVYIVVRIEIHAWKYGIRIEIHAWKYVICLEIHA
jgi:hypothetical protein